MPEPTEQNKKNIIIQAVTSDTINILVDGESYLFFGLHQRFQ